MSKKSPLMLTPISAGFPSPAEDRVDTNLNLHDLVVQRPEATFFMRVEGESMKKAGINSGDLVVVDKSLDPKNRDIVVAFIDGEFTLKRFKREGSRGWLLPENDDYKPLQVSEDNDFQVWGVVTFTLHAWR